MSSVLYVSGVLFSNVKRLGSCSRVVIKGEV